jgi:hypothetical protein
MVSLPTTSLKPTQALDFGLWTLAPLAVCVFYYCRTYYKAVRVGGGGEWRTCATKDDEPRLVWN